MPMDRGTPDLVRHCVAAVAAQYGGDVDKAFAICVATLQRAGYLKKGTMELTAAGKKKEKEHEAEPDAKKKMAAYEKFLKGAKEIRAAEREEMQAEVFDKVASAYERVLGEKSGLMARQEKILKKYVEAGGKAMFFDDLPSDVQGELRRVKDQETLWSDVDRWLSDNNKPAWQRSPWESKEKEEWNDFDTLLNPGRKTGMEDLPRPIARKYESVTQGESALDAMRRLAGISSRYEDRRVVREASDSSQWVIVKKSRHYVSGVVYPDSGGRGGIFDSKEEAEAVAAEMSKSNPVGYAVVPYKKSRSAEGKAESVAGAASAKDFWAFVDEADWGGSGDYDAISKKMFAKYGARKMKEFKAVFSKLQDALDNTVEKWEQSEFGERIPASGFSYSDLLAHIIGLGKKEYDRAMEFPGRVHRRAKTGTYEESFAYVFLPPMGYSK